VDDSSFVYINRDWDCFHLRNLKTHHFLGKIYARRQSRKRHMDLKKHADTVVIITAIVAASVWMVNSVASLRVEMATLRVEMATLRIENKAEINILRLEMNKNFNDLEKRLSKIEDVLILKNITTREFLYSTEINND
jgi:hypothetical protein